MSQKTIAIGTVGVPVDLDTNFGNAQDNFTELYGRGASGVAFTPYGTIAATTVQEAIQELADEKAENTLTAFIAGELADLSILTTAQPVTGEPLVSDTVAYGADEDNLRVWSVEKVGSELEGKAPSLGTDDNYVTDAEKIVIGNTSGTNSGDQDLSSLATKITNGGPVSLGTGSIADGAYATAIEITTGAESVVAGDNVDIFWAETPVGKDGYDTSLGGRLIVEAFAATAKVTVLVSNKSGAAITPGAMTVNWRVVR